MGHDVESEFLPVSFAGVPRPFRAHTCEFLIPVFFERKSDAALICEGFRCVCGEVERPVIIEAA